MLQILLLILKIIGIIILAILGLLLLAVLSILLVPVRYRGSAAYDDEFRCDVRVTWLLHILSLRISYKEVLIARFRIFGFPVYKQTLFGDEEEDSEPEVESDIKEGVVGTIKNIIRVPKKTEELAEDYGPGPDDSNQDSGPDRRPALEKQKQASEASSQRPVADSSIHEEREREQAGRASEPVQENPGLFSRIRIWFRRLLKKLRFAFQNFCDKLKKIKDKKEQIQNFINDEDNRATFALILRQGKRFFKHVLPRRVRGRIAFGFDDPYTTGQVLMYASPFLGWYHKSLSLEPCFDQEILEGNIALRGRIQVATVLLLGFRVYRDRNFRKLLKKWREV